MDTVLITGVSGFLGWHLAQRLRTRYQIYGTYLDRPVSVDGIETVAFDLTDLAKIDRLCSAIKPKTIIHTAALSNVDTCEAEHKLALTLNTFATRDLARAASRYNAKMIYISTDLVFDGLAGMYSEADDPAPLSYHGKTKHLGELEVTHNTSDYILLRPSLLFGRGRPESRGPLDQMEQRLRAGSRLDLFVDQFRTPLFVGDLVAAIERFLARPQLKGLFHLGGPERLSRYEFGRRFCDVWQLPTSLLSRGQLDSTRLVAVRPKDCSLSSQKALRCLDFKLTPVEEALRQSL